MHQSINSRFVIQQHHMPDGVHWDLMLEKGDKLWTWRLDRYPPDTHQALAAERIFDHPLKFLTYEGAVRNGTGKVVIADRGTLQYRDITADTITFRLDGDRIKGTFILQLDAAPQWTLSRPDQ